VGQPCSGWQGIALTLGSAVGVVVIAVGADNEVYPSIPVILLLRERGGRDAAWRVSTRSPDAGEVVEEEVLPPARV